MSTFYSRRNSCNSALNNLCELSHDFDDIFNSFFASEKPSKDVNKSLHPKINITDSKDNIVIHAALPGVVETDIKITLTADGLRILTQGKAQKDTTSKPYYEEIPDGQYARFIPLETLINESGISAAFNNGILTVTLPKADKEKPTHVDIKIGLCRHCSNARTTRALLQLF